MASVHEYKRFENKLVQKIKNGAVKAVGLIGAFFAAIGKFFTKPYTIIFVPHSEKNVFNLHITALSVICFILVISGVVGAFFWYGATGSNVRYAMIGKETKGRDAQASLDQYKDEVAIFMRTARNFRAALSGVLSDLGFGDNSSVSQNTSGDLNSMLGITETPDGVPREINDLRYMSEYMTMAVKQVKEIGTLLGSQNALLTEIPSIWPIKSGLGWITMFFGQNINPINGQYYIHKGIDIATHRYGDPVVATADGQVVTAEYTYDFGNYIIIRHNHGYYTRYAHLQSFRVYVGQKVQQSEVIGYVGNTGISTGPHLHYEVYIGSDVVDPYKYITLRSTIAKQGR